MHVLLKNEQLTVTVDTLGAQMLNLQLGGTEYLWQGDPQYWGSRAPHLFPFIGRLTQNSYRLGETVYPMSIHGFAAASTFSVTRQEKNHLVLELTDTPETRKQYPFRFALRVSYQLVDNRVVITYQVENRDVVTLPFGIGGHPGFRVPLAEGEDFADYTLTFSQPCQPDRVGFTDALFLSGRDERYPLVNEQYIPLHHSLFDKDAVILKNVSHAVTLKSGISGRGVRVDYPDMPYLGIWHKPKSDAPYVCIEPWSSLPARQDVVEDFYCKSDMIQLSPGRVYENTWSITLF